MTVLSIFSLDGQTEGATPTLPSGYANAGSGAAFECRVAEKYSEDFGLLLPASASSFRRLEHTFAAGALTSGSRYVAFGVLVKAFGSSATYFFSMPDGTTSKLDLRWNTGGATRTVSLRNIANANAIQAGTYLYSANVKYRFEVAITIGGNIVLNTYLWDGTSVLETVTLAATSITSLSKYYLGMTSFIATYSAAYGDIRFGDAPIGPWTVTPPPYYFTKTPVFPLYAAHRFGEPGPESVTYAAEQAYARSHTLALEADLQILADGAIAMCHDATINRTVHPSSPILTGNCNSFDTATWRTIRFAPSAGSDTWRLGELVDDYAAAFGPAQSRDPIFVPEIKTGSGSTGPINRLLALGLQDRSIVQSFSLAYAQAAAAAGFEALYLATSEPTWASIKSSGINHVGMNKTLWTGAMIVSAHTAGIKCWAYTVNTTGDRDTLLALGMDAFFTDNPEILSPAVISNRSKFLALI